MHIITGGHDAEQRRDGDYLSKDERYARTDEYLDIVRLAWTSDQPFSYDGQYYQVEDFVAASSRPRSRDPAVLRRLVRGGLPGRRQARRHLRAVGRAAGRDQAADRLGQRRRRAAGRADVPGISVSFRPILGPTEELAWERAHRILEIAKENVAAFRAQWGAKRSAAAATSRRTSARSGCSPPPPRASCTTGRCGRRSPPRPAPAATRPRWSARRRRSPRRCSTTSTSASRTHPHPRLRPVRRRDRLRPPPAAAGPRGGRQARRGKRAAEQVAAAAASASAAAVPA